jgi:hypothetical protein
MRTPCHREQKGETWIGLSQSWTVLHAKQRLSGRNTSDPLVSSFDDPAPERASARNERLGSTLPESTKKEPPDLHSGDSWPSDRRFGDLVVVCVGFRVEDEWRPPTSHSGDGKRSQRETSRGCLGRLGSKRIGRGSRLADGHPAAEEVEAAAFASRSPVCLVLSLPLSSIIGERSIQASRASRRAPLIWPTRRRTGWRPRGSTNICGRRSAADKQP